MQFAADFETTTNPDDTRVWAWAICEIGNTENIKYGNSMDSFIEYCKKQTYLTLYFHNLKFDGEFILNYLLRNHYKWVKERKELKENTFTTLISDTGVFYSIEICFHETVKYKNITRIYDSLKILPFSVDKMSKAFNLPVQKLQIDYEEEREIGHQLTEEEIAYIKNDVIIVSMAIEKLHKQNLKKMTTASNAMADYKRRIGKNHFEKWFPVPDEGIDGFIRKSYKGGFTYLNPKYESKDVGDGIVLDVNSLYPSVMYYCEMPFGEGKYFKGEYERDELYNLYIQHFICQFELKPEHIPTVQIKNMGYMFNPVQYLSSSNGEYVELYMTNVDFELFKEHYYVYDLSFIDGWKYRSAKGMFRKYIDYWNEVKVNATKEGNGSLRSIAKLMLNSLYGKFALNPEVQSKIPYLEDGIVKYHLGEKEHRNPIYIPVGTFITAWARNKTIRSAQSVYDRFIYADTDSLHLEGLEEPKGLEIDSTKLGAWKKESEFTRARFIRQKSYIEEINGELKITCAGMPDRCHQYVTWDNFREGAEFKGKLKHTHTVGGVVLLPTAFTIKTLTKNI